MVKMLTRRGTAGSEKAQESYCAFDGEPPSSKEVETLGLGLGSD